MNTIITVKISRRPTSISNERNHFANAGSAAQVNAGPVAPNAGPVLPRAEIDVPIAVTKSRPTHCKTKTETTH